MLNGCLTQLAGLGSVVLLAVLGFLVLLGPAIGNVFSNIQSDLVAPLPTNTITRVPLTETPTPTATASATITASATFTATNTATATETHTLTATFTPTETATSTETSTPTETATPTEIPTETATFTPTFTPTPAPICTVASNQNARINVRIEAFAGSDLIGQLPIGAVVDVYAVSEPDPDGFLWYFIEDADGLVEEEPQIISGWIREDLVDEQGDCTP